MSRCTLEDYRKNKDKITKRSPSVAEIKTEIRKQFKERLRSVRDNVLDKKRILFEDFTIFELKERLLETFDYPDNTDMLTAYAEIEEEIKNEYNMQQAQQYQNDIENETNSFLSNFMEICSVCDTLTVTNSSETNVICSLCAKNYFSSEKL